MEIIALDNTKRSRNPRVAAYARVSTDTEEQKSSYDSQVGYFTELIQNNPKWDFAGVYDDLGKSGLKAEMRPGFLRIIEDAKAGKMDVILVKSISRFARNSLEAQEYIHLLKEYDVEVRFEREGFSSYDPQAEMVFNFLTAVAEQEPKSISENTSWALKRLAEKGIRHLGSNRVLGYDEIDGVLTPNEQAWIPNGCKNLIIPEAGLLEALTDALGAEWKGTENVDEKIFKNLKTVKIYEDGRIEIEMCAEQRTA